MATDNPQASNLVTSDQQRAPYTTWKITTTYRWKSGTAMMPVAGQLGIGVKQQAEVIQCVSPYGDKIVQFVARRQGEMPDLPELESNDSNQILAGAEVSVSTPDVMTDFATQVYEVSGKYVYYFLQPVEMKDGKLFMGGSPFVTTPKVLNVVMPQKFRSDLAP